jgi:hypothetical protein
MQAIPVVGRTNGRAKQFGVLKLGDTIEERRPVEVNGRQLQAWVATNGRYPASVAAELDDARNRWMAARRPVDPSAAIPSTLWDAAETLADVVDAEEPEAIATAVKTLVEVVRELQEEPELRSSEVEWARYLTRALCALIPGLEEHEAELLNPLLRLTVVRELGYLRPVGVEGAEADNDEEAGGEPQSPPETGPSSTGAEPEPDSAGSTE